MDVRLLGPVELWSAGREVVLGTPQRRCVLAALAITPGKPVTVDGLVDRVWGERLPGDARNVLQTHVSRLRGLLAQAGGEQARRALRRVGDGYVLELPEDQVDLPRARTLAARARAVAGAGAEGDQQAARVLREATALRRGTPLAGLRGDWAEIGRAHV